MTTPLALPKMVIHIEEQVKGHFQAFKDEWEPGDFVGHGSTPKEAEEDLICQMLDELLEKRLIYGDGPGPVFCRGTNECECSYCCTPVDTGPAWMTMIMIALIIVALCI